MGIAEDTREITPGRGPRRDDPTSLYWVRDDTVMYGSYPVKAADATSFRFYLGSFAKDRKHCYCTSTRLAGGNGATFRALNFTYATDGNLVWTMSGKVKDADAASFVVCDDGVSPLIGGGRAPYGFGRDNLRVYYYDFNGKPNRVRKASPASFVSLNDGCFGADAQFVFCGASTIPKARVGSWRKIGGYYSRDDARIFYFNREMKDADRETFEVVPAKLGVQLARDKNHCSWNDRVVELGEFESMRTGAD